MGYGSLRACVEDVRKLGELVVLDDEVDSYLEVAEIQRRVYRSGGPAVLLTRVRGTAFPVLLNLFGTTRRAHYLFRDVWPALRAAFAAKADPTSVLTRPSALPGLARVATAALPMRVRTGPVREATSELRRLPQVTSWPADGGPFITLPLVYSEHPDSPGWMGSNLGMYRVQLAGNAYGPSEVGLHYQLHRGIGVHHRAAIARHEPLRVNVFVGGPPAFTLAAILPLPEGLPEVAFAGALNGRRMRLIAEPGRPHVFADADFVLEGYVLPGETKPEGPFGDHLGYYARQHDFPVLHVERVTHRRDAIWPYTCVGRPPQEDTTFGSLIHELTGPAIGSVVAGVRQVHAVDAAGVHPLLLAVGSERYRPYAKLDRPMEVLTQACAILGTGQLSLAKYLFIAAEDDDRTLDAHDVEAFLRHVLERFDPREDVRFLTNTSIDTLDYSGDAWQRGSKVIVAGVGSKKRPLGTTVPGDLCLPSGFGDPRVVLPGVLVVRAPRWTTESNARRRFCEEVAPHSALCTFPFVVLVDDAEFAARRLDNFLWVTFTRSNPQADMDGVGAFVRDKAWGAEVAVVIDAREKPHHAPALVEDPHVTAKVDARAARGGPLGRYL